MKALLSVVFLVSMLAGKPLNAQDVFQRADAFFSTYATGGAVNYPALSSRPEVERAMLYDIGRTSLHSRSVQYRTAFLINAYNTLTIIRLSQSGKPSDTGGSSEDSYLVAGQQRSLAEIKTDLLQKGDWRIALALACGEAGCPPPPAGAYMPDQLDRQLDENASRVLNHPAHVRSDHRNRMLQVPGIFATEPALNGASGQEILKFINRYRTTPVPEDYSLGFGPSAPDKGGPAGR